MANDRRPSRYTLIAAATLIAAGPRADAEDAASLVRRVRQQEAWIDGVESLRLKAEIRWESTPEAIEHKRKELQGLHPGADLSNHSSLKPTHTELLELAFDRKRIYLRKTRVGQDDDLRIWDGSRMVIHNRYDKAPDRDGYVINRDPRRWLSGELWTHFSSFRVAPHVFWWHGPEQREKIVRSAGEPETFVYEGRTEYRGTPCHVVNQWQRWRTLYIGVEDGRLIGLKSGSLATTRFERWYLEQLRARRYKYRDVEEMNQAGEPPREVSRAIEREGARRLQQVIDPGTEHWFSDEQELAPGCRLPMTQVWADYEVGEDDKPFVVSKHTLRITEVEVNEPLPDALFAVEFKDGEWINDQTHVPPLRYRAKADMEPDEWEAIVADGRRRAERARVDQRMQAALIGRPAARFPGGATWLNGGPLELADQAGKVVILDFWAEWCAPCRADMRLLASVHEKLPDGMLVIGVHPPGSALDAVRKVANEFGMNYPICVDNPAPPNSSAWGFLYDAYGVVRIPHAVLIDKQGKIAATGELTELLLKASQLAGKPSS